VVLRLGSTALVFQNPYGRAFLGFLLVNYVPASLVNLASFLKNVGPKFSSKLNCLRGEFYGYWLQDID